jgi:hypothetical protein
MRRTAALLPWGYPLERLHLAYSVEKLGSRELEIFPMNEIARENQP